jgi:polyhydroxybutyrate depolymerase
MHTSRWWFFVVALVASWSCARAADTGCGRPVVASGVYTLRHHGVSRRFGVHVPAGYDGRQPVSVVLAFHGWGGDETEFIGDAAVTQDADRRGVLVVAPRGLGSGTPDRRNNSWTFRGSASGVSPRGEPICDATLTPDYRYPSCRSDVAKSTCSWTQCQDDDVDFVRTLVARVQSTWCVDAERVYAVGGSNGGMFVWELLQNPATAKLIRAAAPIVGLPHRGYLDGPAGATATPVILITGRRDPVVPPGAWDDPSATTTSNDSDRFYYTGATAIMRRWAAAAGCPVAATEASTPVGSPQADCRSYCAPADGRWPRVLDCRADMGHAYGLDWSWPLLMDFFSRQ